jgi:hypothetical protein
MREGAGVSKAGRSSSGSRAGASQCRTCALSSSPLPPIAPLDGVAPDAQDPVGINGLSDVQLFAIQRAVAFIEAQWQARSNISKTTHNDAMNAIGNLK